MRGDSEQQRLQYACQRKGADQPKCDANRNQPQSAGENHAQHVLPLRANRHPDANLLRSLDHRLRDDAVETNRGERQREGREKAEELRRQATRSDGIVDELFEGIELPGWQARIVRRKRRTHIADE